jgi:hypothetical protein
MPLTLARATAPAATQASAPQIGDETSHWRACTIGKHIWTFQIGTSRHQTIMNRLDREKSRRCASKIGTFQIETSGHQTFQICWRQTWHGE